MTSEPSSAPFSAATSAAGSPPPPGSPPGPPPGTPVGPPPGPPPGGPGAGESAGFTTRYGLVRPRQGRYVAGVCAAIGRATNTDPVLWRVLLAVLGFFGGIGILVYLAGWLVIPAEGDTASPVESMLGRGRSSMSPVTVIVLGVLAAVMFGLIVTDGFRAAVLGAAALIGVALLLNRKPGSAAGPSAPGGGPGGPDLPGGPAWPGAPADGTAPVPGGMDAPAPAGGTGTGPSAMSEPTVAAAGAEPPTVVLPVPPTPPAAPMPPVPPSPVTPAGAYAHQAYTPAPPPPPPGGYRQPFAPHGPYAGPGPYPPQYAPPPRPPKPPKPPKQRSPLGAATFSLIFVAIGTVAALDLSNVLSVSPSAYFAAALVTVALGLLVGAWFGRARWLIALGVIAAAALGISTIAESQVNHYGGTSGSDVVWQPKTIQAVADRYEHSLGRATLDLTQVDFTGQEQTIDVELNLGELEVILPPTVDVTVNSEVSAGDADVLGNTSSGFHVVPSEVVDNGTDGPGGGKINMTLKVNGGSLEVHR
ncbi:PspC domain-containing protein [Phytohabitans aurantiacus]|uniref:PspC domain-containing protein n=1 Tax=Phytohabitans aurantiacus TaxID=3016789 RepID=UPI0024908E75|nr:PspC domain-containing protein [Phytohabitans aurantiacus]